jgi:hypothetical protein
MVHALEGTGDREPGDIHGATALVLRIIALLAPATQRRKVTDANGPRPAAAPARPGVGSQRIGGPRHGR